MKNLDATQKWRAEVAPEPLNLIVIAAKAEALFNSPKGWSTRRLGFLRLEDTGSRFRGDDSSYSNLSHRPQVQWRDQNAQRMTNW